MTADEVLELMRKEGVRVSVQSGVILLESRPGVIDHDLEVELYCHADALLSMLLDEAADAKGAPAAGKLVYWIARVIGEFCDTNARDEMHRLNHRGGRAGAPHRGRRDVRPGLH